MNAKQQRRELRKKAAMEIFWEGIPEDRVDELLDNIDAYPEFMQAIADLTVAAMLGTSEEFENELDDPSNLARLLCRVSDTISPIEESFG